MLHLEVSNMLDVSPSEQCFWHFVYLKEAFVERYFICSKQLASMGLEPMTLALLAPRSRPSELTGHVNIEDQLHLLFQCSICTGWTTVEVQYNLVNDSPCVFEIFCTHTHTHGEKKHLNEVRYFMEQSFWHVLWFREVFVNDCTFASETNNWPVWGLNPWPWRY